MGKKQLVQVVEPNSVIEFERGGVTVTGTVSARTQAGNLQTFVSQVEVAGVAPDGMTTVKRNELRRVVKRP